MSTVHVVSEVVDADVVRGMHPSPNAESGETWDNIVGVFSTMDKANAEIISRQKAIQLERYAAGDPKEYGFWLGHDMQYQDYGMWWVVTEIELDHSGAT